MFSANIKKFLLLALTVLPCAVLFSQENPEGRYKFQLELDPYYSSLGYYTSLTTRPIESLGRKTEWEIYSALLKNIYKPRTLVLEASINPLPYAGTLIKRNMPAFYNSMYINGSLNMVQAVTAGFEEPWALSLFLGNVVEFESVKKSFMGKRNGYSGFLVSVGDSHIKDNTLVNDDWVETEIKLKGEQLLEKRDLKWSFRTGYKHHGNINIEDAVYFGVRRSRTDYGENGNFFINNSSIEYVFDASKKNLAPLRHYFLMEKKIPLKDKRFAFTLGLGCVWTAARKYSGPLANAGGSDFSFIIRPNIEF